MPGFAILSDGSAGGRCTVHPRGVPGAVRVPVFGWPIRTRRVIWVGRWRRARHRELARLLAHGALYTEHSPPGVRYTGASSALQVCSAIWGRGGDIGTA